MILVVITYPGYVLPGYVLWVWDAVTWILVPSDRYPSDGICTCLPPGYRYNTGGTAPEWVWY